MGSLALPVEPRNENSCPNATGAKLQVQPSFKCSPASSAAQLQVQPLSVADWSACRSSSSTRQDESGMTALACSTSKVCDRSTSFLTCICGLAPAEGQRPKVREGLRQLRRSKGMGPPDAHSRRPLQTPPSPMLHPDTPWFDLQYASPACSPSPLNATRASDWLCKSPCQPVAMYAVTSMVPYLYSKLPTACLLYTCYSGPFGDANLAPYCAYINDIRLLPVDE